MPRYGDTDTDMAHVGALLEEESSRCRELNSAPREMSQGAVNDYGEAWNAGQQIWNTTVANVSHGAKVLWRSASRNNQVYRCQKKRRETIRFIICFQITPVTAKTMLVVEAGELRHFLPASERRSSLQAVSPAHSECTR